jgi:LuxR family maltose regulon positive regulatory protein
MAYQVVYADGQRPEPDVDAIGAPAPARVGLEVPVETKFHAPNVRREWVERPALTQRLADANARLVLVDAPAGFGKTVAVAQWRASTIENRPFAWVSLDQGDNDPGRLWWHLVCALKRAIPEIGTEHILSVLRQQVAEVTGIVLPILVNELAALQKPVVVVLDDYHVIQEPACHQQIEFLLDHLPPLVQLVLVTRADPLLPLGRLRAAAAMVEIRARDLRFTAEQAAVLVQTVADVQLSEPDLAVLVQRTEGWPAGVYLAALSLRGHPCPHTFVQQFTGENRFVLDFLAEEVLSRQPYKVRQFLARTSVLSRFCAPLCDAVAGTANAVEILDILERENLFIVPLDDTRQWFRYHHLFAQVLRSQLARTEPGAVPALHRSASAWHHRHGSADEAISHAIAAGDLALATDLIANYWFAYADSGQTATVQEWMRSLGDDQIAASPVAAHCAAWAAALSGDRQSARRWLPVIEAGRHDGRLPDGMRSLRFSAALLRGMYGFEGLRVMRDSAATAADLEDDPASPWYALAKAAFGFSLYLSAEPKLAAGPLEEAAHNKAALPLTRIVAMSALALIAVEAGRPAKARQLAQTAHILAQRDDLRRTPSASLTHVAVGAVCAAEGRLGEARAELEQALLSRRRIADSGPWPTLKATLLLAQVLLDAGDHAGAAVRVNEAKVILAALPGDAGAYWSQVAALERPLASPRRAAPLAEQLTEREVTVLRLLSSSLSLREIGQELFVSANTVKTHTQAIYRKLGVSARHDAVVQGNQLGIR